MPFSDGAKPCCARSCALLASNALAGSLIARPARLSGQVRKFLRSAAQELAHIHAALLAKTFQAL
jgi:hypothetical protein